VYRYVNFLHDFRYLLTAPHDTCCSGVARGGVGGLPRWQSGLGRGSKMWGDNGKIWVITTKIGVITTKNGGSKGEALGISRLLWAAKLQSAPGADNPRYTADLMTSGTHCQVEVLTFTLVLHQIQSVLRRILKTHCFYQAFSPPQGLTQ